ncbi:MAG: class I SAM-dependent methyltransferase [Cyanobacteriota bacterium]|nr:class I SAM-dependent methyltransferase [Cyanobacteriota bacterium]
MSSSLPSDGATPVVSAFYDRFPYPGDPLQDGPPPGYNWRWCVDSVRAFVDGLLPQPPQPQQPRTWRILDAGCGTGVSTDYLCHLNPGSSVLAVDISPGALAVARERCQRSAAAAQVAELRIEQRSLLDLGDEGDFDHINSVGVLHHLQEPQAGLTALAQRLRVGGTLHLFLYADGGRWEIQRTQKALQLMDVGHGEDGLRLGRKLLATLPESNRLRRHHEQRWALDTAADANFADMYLHPQECSYSVERLLAFAASSGLSFAGFSNPEVWDPARLLQGELLERAQALGDVERWSLIEALDPDISHFEFFLRRGEPLLRADPSDAALLAACYEPNRCLWGWPSAALLGPDLMPLQLDEAEWTLAQAIEQQPSLPLADLMLDADPATRCRLVRQLLSKRVLHRIAPASGR